MAFRLGTTLKNAFINEIINTLAGTTGINGTAKAIIYSGAMPDNPETEPTGTSGTAICSIINIGWAECTAGTSDLAAAVTGTVGVSGTAGWVRFETINDNGTFRIDGDVGTGATNALVLEFMPCTSGVVLTLGTAYLGAGTGAES